VEIKQTPRNDNLDHLSALASLGAAYIKDEGHNQIRMHSVNKKKKRLSLEAFSRIITNIPTEKITRLVRRTARTKTVKS
jgi:hypothetical protein